MLVILNWDSLLMLQDKAAANKTGMGGGVRSLA